MTIDYTTVAGQVRLLVPDTDESDLLFSDSQVAGFLALAGSNVYRAAALAVETMARNEAMLLKVVSIRGQAGVSTDGAKLAAELRLHATSLRAEADATGGDFEIAEVVQLPYQAADLLRGREVW